MKYIFFLFLLFNFSTNTLEKQITVPYQPPFSVRHPLLVKSLSGSGVGLLTSLTTYAGLQYTNNDSNRTLTYALCAGLLAGAAYLKFSKPTPITLLDATICQPQYVLESILPLNSQLQDVIKENPQQVRTLIQDTEKLNPLVLLTECILDEGGTCVLNRLQNPRYRTAFEQAIGKALSSHGHAHSLVPLQFVSLGSGLAFQELVTLTKWLAKNPEAQISIHLIDKQYWPLATCNKKLENRRGQIDESLLDPAIARSEIIERVNHDFNSSDSDEVIAQKMAVHVIKTHMAHQELLKWLTTKFPRADIKLFIHENAQEYLNSIPSDHHYPDVISAADIEGEANIRNRSMSDYLTLCAKTLEKKPDSTNVLLLKNEQDQPFIYKPALVTCNTQQTATNKKEIYNDFNNQRQSIFFNLDLI